MSGNSEREQTALEQMQAQLQEMQENIDSLITSNRNLTGNLNFLRDLVEECVHLTEQTSGIVVEHVTTLDSRLDSVGSIFTDKIKRQLKELDEATLMDAVITQVGIDDAENEE